MSCYDRLIIHLILCQSKDAERMLPRNMKNMNAVYPCLPLVKKMKVNIGHFLHCSTFLWVFKNKNLKVFSLKSFSYDTEIKSEYFKPITALHTSNL